MSVAHAWRVPVAVGRPGAANEARHLGRFAPAEEHEIRLFPRVVHLQGVDGRGAVQLEEELLFRTDGDGNGHAGSELDRIAVCARTRAQERRERVSFMWPVGFILCTRVGCVRPRRRSWGVRAYSRWPTSSCKESQQGAQEAGLLGRSATGQRERTAAARWAMAVAPMAVPQSTNRA